MKYHKNIISEDNLPKKIYVIFSAQINQDIITIKNNNQANAEALAQWYDYIEGIKRWLSNPSIAWDYANRFAKFPNGSRFIRDFNYNIGYTVKTNQYGAYVYVFMINLNPQLFGLKTIKENKSIYFNNTMKTKKKVIRLTESELHKIVKESVKTILNEIGDTAKGQYMLGRLAARQDKGGYNPQSTDAWKYANKQMFDRDSPRKGEAEHDWWNRRGALEYGDSDERNNIYYNTDEFTKNRIRNYKNGDYDVDYGKEHNVYNGNGWTKVNKGIY